MPRLQPGEIAPGVARKREAIRKSLEWKVDQLTKMLAAEDIPTAFKKHRSMETLCKWTEDELGIVGCSVNAAKSNPELFDKLKSFAGRLRRLSDMQSKAQKKPANCKSSGKKASESETKAALKERNKELRRLVQALTDDLGAVRAAYLDVLQELDSTAQAGKHTREAVKRHFARHTLTAAKAGYHYYQPQEPTCGAS